MIVNLIDNVRRFGIEEVFKRYYSFYRAQVVDPVDPDNQGKIKVKIPDLFGDSDDDALPTPAQPMATFAGMLFGSNFTLKKDDWVYVFFERGDLLFPNYFGGWWAEDEMPSVFQTPNVSGWAFRGGAQIIIDETEGAKKISIMGAGDDGSPGEIFVLDDTTGAETISMFHKSGSQIQIDPKGSLIFASKDGSLLYFNTESGEATLIASTGAVITLGEAITIAHASGAQLITMDDSSIQINAKSNVILTAGDVTVNSGSVELGSNAAFGVCIGDTMSALFDAHIHATALGPSGPPLPPATAAMFNASPGTAITSAFIKLRTNLPG